MIDGSGGSSGGRPRIQLGEIVTLRGSGWLPRSSVRIEIRSTPRHLATAVTDDIGAFEISVTVPRGMAPGRHTMHLAGLDAAGTPRTDSLPVTVVASAGGTARTLPTGARGAEGALANTGLPLGGALLLIGLLLSAGTGLLLVAGRRQAVGSARTED